MSISPHVHSTSKETMIILRTNSSLVAEVGLATGWNSYVLPHRSKGRDPEVSNEAGARGHDSCQEHLPFQVVLVFKGYLTNITN